MSASTSTIRPSRPTRAAEKADAMLMSADASHMSELRLLLRRQHHAYRVDPYLSCGDVAGGQPLSSQLAELADFCIRDRLERGTEAKPGAALHLAEDQRSISVLDFHGDDVDFAITTAPIAIENHHSLPLEFRYGEVFTSRADHLLRFLRRHPAPPLRNYADRKGKRASWTKSVDSGLP